MGPGPGPDDRPRARPAAHLIHEERLMTDNMRFVSADSHVNEPRNLWRDNLPPRLRDQAMRGIEAGDDGNWTLVLEGHQLDKTTKYEEERMLVSDPQHRFQVMREDG